MDPADSPPPSWYSPPEPRDYGTCDTPGCDGRVLEQDYYDSEALANRLGVAHIEARKLCWGCLQNAVAVQVADQENMVTPISHACG